MFKKLFILTVSILTLTSTTHAYLFGMKSEDNSIYNIKKIELDYNIHNYIVAFIFDPFQETALNTISQLGEKLGEDRIYHLTISPNSFSAQEVAEGKFDAEYRKVFQAIKQQNIRVIFRTMHEMNGGRYPRGSNPETFIQARKHVRHLSRAEGLDQHNILFDFSINHRDMPTKGTPSQSAKLITCYPDMAEELDCPQFEDYYPGDAYVDIMGFTFFNRGKATSNRRRLSPDKILNDPKRNTLSRVKAMNKPIFIDEVATTAVYYAEAYNPQKSKEVYATDRDRKNYRLMHFKELLKIEPQIVGFSYFNTDYTFGLEHPSKGEADRSAINLRNNKTYFGIFDLHNHASKNYLENKLLKLFKTKGVAYKGETFFIHSEDLPKLIEICQRLQARFPNNLEHVLTELDLRKNNLDQSFTPNQKEELLTHISILQNFITLALNK